MNTTSTLKHTIRINHPGLGDYTVIKISLDDDCRNGREDWSVTADIFENHRNEGGGCCHDHILSLRPDLADFVALHLCDFTGVPMHSIANGFYWFAGWKGGLGEKYHAGSGSDAKTPERCRELFQENFRATPEEMAAFDTCGAMTKEELQAVGEDLGLPARWRRESEAAIARLEGLTGRKFESKATKPGFEPLKPEVRALIAERKASGYYSPEAVAARLAEALAAKKAKALAELEEEHAAKVERLRADLLVKRVGSHASQFPEENQNMNALAKHAPGPWAYTPPKRGERRKVLAFDGAYIVAADIAGEGNALLIAAAPELAAALLALVGPNAATSLCIHKPKDGLGRVMGTWSEDAAEAGRAALRKAGLLP